MYDVQHMVLLLNSDSNICWLFCPNCQKNLKIIIMSTDQALINQEQLKLSPGVLQGSVLGPLLLHPSCFCWQLSLLHLHWGHQSSHSLHHQLHLFKPRETLEFVTVGRPWLFFITSNPAHQHTPTHTGWGRTQHHSQSSTNLPDTPSRPSYTC